MRDPDGVTLKRGESVLLQADGTWIKFLPGGDIKMHSAGGLEYHSAQDRIEAIQATLPVPEEDDRPVPTQDTLFPH